MELRPSCSRLALFKIHTQYNRNITYNIWLKLDVNTIALYASCRLQLFKWTRNTLENNAIWVLLYISSFIVYIFRIGSVLSRNCEAWFSHDAKLLYRWMIVVLCISLHHEIRSHLLVLGVLLCNANGVWALEFPIHSFHLLKFRVSQYKWMRGTGVYNSDTKMLIC